VIRRVYVAVCFLSDYAVISFIVHAAFARHAAFIPDLIIAI
jgi:hypothetical protein